MVHSQLELASFPIHLAAHNQAAFTVVQRLNVLPLKLRQFDPLPRLSASLEQFQSLSVDSQPNIALGLLLPVLPTLSIVIQLVIVVVVVVNVIDVVIVASLQTILGPVSSVNVVGSGALGQSSWLSLVVRDLPNILARPQSRDLDSATQILLSAVLLVNVLGGIEQHVGRVALVQRLSLPLLRHHLLQLLRVHGGDVIVGPVIRQSLRVSYEHLLSFVRVQAASVTVSLMETGAKSVCPSVVDLRLMLIYIQDQRLRDVVLQEKVIAATVFLGREGRRKFDDFRG